jgi:hypothetical protein
VRNGSEAKHLGGVPVRNAIETKCGCGVPVQNAIETKCRNGVPVRNGIETKCRGGVPVRNGIETKCRGGVPVHTGWGTEFLAVLQCDTGGASNCFGIVQCDRGTAGLFADHGPFAICGTAILVQNRAEVSDPTGRHPSEEDTTMMHRASFAHHVSSIPSQPEKRHRRAEPEGRRAEAFRSLRTRLARATILLLCLLASSRAAVAAQLIVYDDVLPGPFQDWSWAAHDLHATAHVHGGAYAISMVPANWEGLYFHHPGFAVEENGTLELWVHGGNAGNQQIRFYLYRNNNPLANAELETFLPGGAIPAGTWAKATIPFSALGVTTGSIDGLIFQADAAGTQPMIWLDDLVLLDTAGPPQPVTVSVDPSADRRAINPLIYGVNFGDAAEFAAVPYTLRRWGGNSVTRYNWQKDATNRASDWFYINLPEGPDSTGLPNGSSADLWIDETLDAGSGAIVTIPTIGWTARDRVKRWGFSVAKYGPQQQTECSATGWPSWCAEDAGNGVRPDGSLVTGNDPHDTSVEVGPPFATGWVQHVVGRFGSAQAGGVAFYALDNEPMLWNSTHRDVHPDPATLDELWAYTRSYAEAIKMADPTARTLGPVVWGWCAYFYSALDGCTPGPDMAAHGGLPLIEWYLMKNRERELQTGTRPVDYLDIHYYPQANGVALTDDESVAALRLRSLQSLYDSSYVDESWIGQPVRLIPRMKEWIAARCPGMKLAITEYNWGGDQGISSALAQAEALAIYGREGVDLATRWVAPQAGSRVVDAFRLYLDYDGAHHALLGESVRAVSSDREDVGAYAILRDGGTQVALLLFNKAVAVRTTTVTIAGAASGPAPVYRFDDATALAPAGTLALSGEPFSIDLPARSATLLLVNLAGVSAIGADAEGFGGESARDRRAPELCLTATPNPFRAEVAIRGVASREVPVPIVFTAEICDAAGRLVRRLDGRTSVDARAVALTWDGCDGSDAPVPSGVYFARVRAGAAAEGTLRLLKVQ